MDRLLKKLRELAEGALDFVMALGAIALVFGGIGLMFWMLISSVFEAPAARDCGLPTRSVSELLAAIENGHLFARRRALFELSCAVPKTPADLAGLAAAARKEGRRKLSAAAASAVGRAVSESVDDLVLSARGLLPVRAGLSSICLAAAVAALPNLEDAGLLALMVLGASGCAAALSVLVGGVWSFDAKDLPEARERARTLFEVGGFAAGVFCLALLTQASSAPAWWPRWGYAGLCAAAWLAWTDMPWTALEARLEARREPVSYDRYRVAESPAPPAPAAPKELPPGVEAMLVSSGSFRVDRARMLKVLSGYQLADPCAFLLPWLRLAVASGAKDIELASRPDGLDLRFDGRPLGPRYLQDPYLALLGDEEDGERHKHLAYGLLGLLALTPRAVLGVSGPEGAVLRAEPNGAAAMEPPAPDLRGRTVLRVVFDGWSARLRALEAISKARSSWGLTDARLVVDGKAVPGWELEAGKGRRFEESGAQGLVYGRVGSNSRLRVYSLGVLAGEKDFYPRDLAGSVSVHASYATLRLDASQGKVVEDAVFAEFMNRMEAVCRGRAAAADRRPDLAWAAARLSGRRNPFRP